MPVDILVGTQWGDEGKGKLIDVLTRDVDMVVRFQGGNNAGHTVEIGSERYVLHLVPSGIFRKGVRCVIGNGLVVDPVALTEEMKGIAEKGFDVSAIELSNRAQLIFEYHKRADVLNETGAGSKKIGTTKRGIGPAYADKMHRCGIRAIDLTAPERLEPQFRAEAAKYNKLFSEHGIAQLDIDAEWQRVREAAAYLAPRVCDTVYSINAALKAGKKVLCEGAQGALLDIDHGTYPFVTSSNTTSGGACTGAGIAPQHVRDCWGVIKAYTTRVGEGPFPTELFDEAGEQLRVNFSRVEWTTEVKDGKYVKIPMPGEDKIREYNWVWAPTGVINIHLPELWGYVQIADQVAGQGETPFVKRPEEETKWFLRNLYYRQNEYLAATGRYADNLQALRPEEVCPPAIASQLKIYATPSMYEITLPAPDGTVWRIRQDGLVWATGNKE